MGQGCSSKPDDSKNLDPPHLSSGPFKSFGLRPFVENDENNTNSLSGRSPPTKKGRTKNVEKIFRGPALDEYTREGFDEKNIYACRNQEILKADLSCEKTRAEYVNRAKIAIGAFNEKYNEKPQLQYEDLVTATYQDLYGMLYYLTFRAKSSAKKKSETYQAILADYNEVLAFRLKPKKGKRGPKKWFWDDASGQWGKYQELYAKRIKENKRMLASNKIKGEQGRDQEVETQTNDVAGSSEIKTLRPCMRS